MADHATPNLPSADFQCTADFYAALGFHVRYRAEGWMILQRGDLTLEFFPAPIDPKKSWFGSCLRLDDLDAFHAVCAATELSRDPRAIPRLGDIRVEHHAIRIFYLVDPDGSLLRCLDNRFVPATRA